jgi:flagellar protein FlgJ
MAISPPSDLVLDVVRAADPAEVQEAQARLKANRAAFQATSLAEN